MPFNSPAGSRRYVKSGRTRSMPGISSSGNDIPASTRMIPLPWRTAVMFLPISPNPPRGTTCKVSLSNNSSDYLLMKASGKACSLLSVQVPTQVELLRSDGGEVHMVCFEVLSGQAQNVVRGHRLDAGGDLLGRQQLSARYDAATDAVHPRRGALEGQERRAFELLLGTLQLLFLDGLLPYSPELLDDHLHGLLHVARGGADVGLDRARVRVSLMVGVDGVC